MVKIAMNESKILFEIKEHDIFGTLYDQLINRIVSHCNPKINVELNSRFGNSIFPFNVHRYLLVT